MRSIQRESAHKESVAATEEIFLEVYKRPRGKLENKKRANSKMKCVAVIALLSLLSLGHSAPLSSCDSLVKPITISNEDVSAIYSLYFASCVFRMI